MEAYQNLVLNTLESGTHRPNRTAVDTISTFQESYEIDASDAFPLLTTKQMSEFRWQSMIHELLWYFSGEHHIRNLREETKIWDAWADDDWNLPSAYGRFWRRFPVPENESHLPGEAWAGIGSPWVSREYTYIAYYPVIVEDAEEAVDEAVDEFIADLPETISQVYPGKPSIETRYDDMHTVAIPFDVVVENGESPADELDAALDATVLPYSHDSDEVVGGEASRLVFDQLQYVIDTLNGDNPDRDPNSRRLVVNAWHPANADVSGLPPCHYTFVFNVQGGDTLNLHLTQRSGDVALGIPFNIAAYSLLLRAVSQQTGYEVGNFGHTIVDAHIYCGKGERGDWYAEHLDELQSRLSDADSPDEYRKVRQWILEEAPADTGADDPEAHEYGYDHVPGLIEQVAREPLQRPSLSVADKPIDELTYDDIELKDYESHSGLGFDVAE